MDTTKRSMSISQTGAGRKASVASASKDASADAALAKMGYASELPRNLSMLSVLGLYVLNFFWHGVVKIGGDR